MHSYATSKIRESRPEHLGCTCSSKCSAALVSRIKCESDNLANRRRQPKPTAHRSHNSSFSTSRPCYYCDIHVNSDPEKMESVLHPQTNRPVPVPSPPTPPPSGGWVSGSWKCQTALSHPVLVREWAPGGMTSRKTSQTRQWNGDRTAMLITYVNVSKRAYFSVMLKSYTSNGYNLNGWVDLQTRRVLKK